MAREYSKMMDDGSHHSMNPLIGLEGSSNDFPKLVLNLSLSITARDVEGESDSPFDVEDSDSEVCS